MPGTFGQFADPVQLGFALHRHPLQGGQVQHCARPDVVVVVVTAVKVVVEKLGVERDRRCWALPPAPDRACPAPQILPGSPRTHPQPVAPLPAPVARGVPPVQADPEPVLLMELRLRLPVENTSPIKTAASLFVYKYIFIIWWILFFKACCPHNTQGRQFQHQAHRLRAEPVLNQAPSPNHTEFPVLLIVATPTHAPSACKSVLREPRPCPKHKCRSTGRGAGVFQAPSGSGTHTSTASHSPKNLIEGVGDEMLLLVAAQAEQLGAQLPAELLRRHPRLLLLQLLGVEHLGREERAQRRERGSASSHRPPGTRCRHSARCVNLKMCKSLQLYVGLLI